MLAAARQRDLAMFGDLPGSASHFESRSTTALRRHTFAEDGRDFDPDLDADGALIVFASTRHSLEPDLYFKSVDGMAVTQFTTDPSADIQPAISPDGSRVAFASNRSGNWDIWVKKISGGPAVQITRDLSDDLHPSWSPDANTLVYCSLPASSGQWELWTTKASADGHRKFIGYGLFPEWSPRDNRIVFQRARERGGRWFSIWTLTIAGGEPGFATEVASSAHEAFILPSWSDDGTHIAFTSIDIAETSDVAASAHDPIEMMPSGVWIIRADGGNRTRVTDYAAAHYSPTFGGSGRIYFSSTRGGFENIWSADLSAGPGKPVDSSIAQDDPEETVVPASIRN